MEGSVKLRDREAIGARDWLDQYSAVREDLPGADLPWVLELRDSARDRFAALGLPTNKIEAWKYTSLRPLSRMPFGTPPAQPGDAAVPELLGSSERAARIVFVDGHLAPEKSDRAGLPDGVSLAGLAETLTAKPELLEHQLGKIGQFDDHPMLALNTALMSDGLVLRIGRGVAVEQPIELVHVTTAGEGSPALHPRHLIIAEPGSRATLVERYVGATGSTYMLNGAAEIRVGEGAALHHYKVQDEGSGAYHLFLNQVRIGRDALYDNLVLSLGGRLARNQIEAVIEGAGAECRLNGAYVGGGRQHLDHTSVIDHAAPNARSRQVYHGVLDGQSRGVFQGQIVVRQAAQKTDGYQINRALLLSDGAEIDSKPNLEIYADDVKCSHGATVGDLDPDALFYLRARGIPEKEARGLLVEAFLAEPLEEIADEAIREKLRAHVARRLQERT